MQRLLLALFLSATLPVNAAPFGNGDFTVGGALWNDSINSRVTLDNIQFASSLPAVPASSVIALLLAGLPFTRRFYKQGSMTEKVK